LLETAIALHHAAMKDEYFIKRKLAPNVDFWFVPSVLYRSRIETTILHLGGDVFWDIVSTGCGLTDHSSGLIYRAMGSVGHSYSLSPLIQIDEPGFPLDFFPVLFAVPRVVGWLAHWRQVCFSPEGVVQLTKLSFAR